MGKGRSTIKTRQPKNNTTGWTSEVHKLRMQSKLTKLQKNKHSHDNVGRKNSYKRTAFARNSRQRIQDAKLKLHITKLKRHVDTLRERLRVWDDQEEEERLKTEEEEERKRKQREEEEAAASQGAPKKKRKVRPGPETWKLRGAARPAWEVYDFDTRYVCPHIKAHEDANAKAKRCRNLLALYRGNFGSNDAPQPVCRRLVSMLVQLGHLNAEAQKFKAAREAFLECMELEGDESPPMTNSRYRLMRMYLEANRPDSARRLWERFEGDDSVWIRYSAALIEYVSWKLLGESGSSRETAEELLVRAIKSNVFCAYQIAFWETFGEVMEYVKDIEDADEKTLEEGIEYCASEQMGHWLGTEGAVTWIRNVLLMVLQNGEGAGGRLKKDDLEWKEPLTKQVDGSIATKSDEETMEGEDDDEEEEEQHDTPMYAGMFRTAMEMLEENGEFDKPIEESHDENEDQKEEETANENKVSAETVESNKSSHADEEDKSNEDSEQDNSEDESES